MQARRNAIWPDSIPTRKVRVYSQEIAIVKVPTATPGLEDRG
jgi:hypothetical protein